MGRLRVTGIVMLVALALAAAGPVRAGEADEFFKGLEQRGLQTLTEAYLRQQGEAIETGEAPAAGPPGQKEMELAGLAVQQAARAQNMAARDEAFKQARDLYEKAIAARQKAVEAIPADKLTERNDARLHLIRARLALANMVFQQWLKADLDLLEVAQRYGGNRERVTRLLRIATDAYRATVEDCEQWLSNLAMIPGDDYRRFTNLGKRRDVNNMEKEAKYFSAWAQYYYGWMLPKDYKPPEGDRNRKQILNDAITAFMPSTDEADRVSAKWYAMLGIGMAYRELGEHKKALQQLAKVNPPPVSKESPRDQSWKQDVRIRVTYERALTHVAMGQPAKARETIVEARKQFGDAVNENLYGLALPIVEASSYIAQGNEENKQDLKDKGVEILRQVHQRDNPWPMIVQWVMEGLVGQTPAGELKPFQLWIRANDLMAQAQDSGDAKKMKEAADLFGVYIEKVGPEDENYPMALYTRAAALLQLGQKGKAADLFRQVAEKFPDYKYAAASAQYAVGVRGQVYENSKTEENRQAYEDALRWFVTNFLKSDPEQQYFYALVLYRGEKYLDAADAFARVPEAAEHYPDSRFWVALCQLEYFRNKVLTSKDEQVILSGARKAAKMLLDYTEYAFEAQNTDLPDAKKQQLLDWAQAAYINAADVYLYQEVGLPADALPILETMEKKFTLSEEARGRVLKLKIDAYQKLGRLPEARQVLSEFLDVAKPKDVGPVLRGLFSAMTDDVRELIKRGKKDLASTKVDQAKKLGDRFLQWLKDSNLPNKDVEIENTRYDLAELYLAVGNYETALQIYQEIAGPRPEEVEPGTPLPEEAIYGMARAYEGLGDAAASADQAKPHYQRALELWRVLRDVADLAPQDKWERDYHLYYCKYRLGQKDEVAEALKALRIMTEGPVGGNDAALQKKFRDLAAKVGA